MTDTAAPTDRTHFRRLDGLRGVAVLMVVAFHCFGYTFGRWQLPWQVGGWLATVHPSGERLGGSYLALYPFAFGWTGVAVFFVLSGFVIHHAQLRAGLGPMNVLAYAGRRACRILPPYLLAVLAFAAVADASADDPHAIATQLVAHATLLHNLRPFTYWGLNPSFWSLAVEVQFYALYPVLWWVRRRSGSAAAPLLLSGLVSAAWWAVQWSGTDWRSATEVSTFVWWNTPALWSSWALGMFLADRFASHQRAFTRPAMWAAALAIAFVAATLSKPTWGLAFPLAAGLSAVVIEQALWSDRWAWLGRRWLVGVGLVSYSLYLWHQPLIPPIVRAIGRAGSPAVRFPLVLGLTLAVAGTLSLVLYAAVERPSQRAAKRFARR